MTMHFEGEQVDGYQVVMRQFRGDIELPLTVDEIVELRVRVRVKQVGYEVNERNGQMHRVHTLKVEEVSKL